MKIKMDKRSYMVLKKHLYLYNLLVSGNINAIATVAKECGKLEFNEVDISYLKSLESSFLSKVFNEYIYEEYSKTLKEITKANPDKFFAVEYTPRPQGMEAYEISQEIKSMNQIISKSSYNEYISINFKFEWCRDLISMIDFMISLYIGRDELYRFVRLDSVLDICNIRYIMDKIFTKEEELRFFCSVTHHICPDVPILYDMLSSLRYQFYLLTPSTFKHGVDSSYCKLIDEETFYEVQLTNEKWEDFGIDKIKEELEFYKEKLERKECHSSILDKIKKLSNGAIEDLLLNKGRMSEHKDELEKFYESIRDYDVKTFDGVQSFALKYDEGRWLSAVDNMSLPTKHFFIKEICNSK